MRLSIPLTVAESRSRGSKVANEKVKTVENACLITSMTESERSKLKKMKQKKKGVHKLSFVIFPQDLNKMEPNEIPVLKQNQSLFMKLQEANGRDVTRKS